MEIRFKDLKPGDLAEVTGFDTSEKAYRSRLGAMGLTRGVEVKFIRSAPMGDPVEIEVRGYNLSIRKEEAAIVKLRRI